MRSELKDTLLMLLVLVSTALVFYLFIRARGNAYLLAGLALVVLPCLLAYLNGPPFVPAPMAAAKRMVAVAALKPGDIVYDIGCGDGRIVYIAAKEPGVTGVGVELSPIVYLLARARKILWGSKARIKLGSFRRQDLSDADVVFCYLSVKALEQLEPKLKSELKKGARVVSLGYRVGSWKEKEEIAFTEDGVLYNIRIYEKD
jgi:SAM-dependent methyltransferase